MKQQKVHQPQDKDENKKGQPSHTTVQKLETHETLQTYKPKHCIQKHEHNTAIYKTKDPQ